MIPEGLNENLTKKLVSYWSDTLIKPYLHDKIEFEIIDGSFDQAS